MSYTLLSEATGAIQAGPEQQERLEEFTERVGSGEFHISTNISIPCACIDGRGGGTPRPDAAGGTNTLVVSEDLTNSVSVGYIESFDDVIQKLTAQGLPIGGHDDAHASDQKCGCGACDRLRDIYAMITQKADAIRGIVQVLGADVSARVHHLILKNAEARHNFPSGPDLKLKMTTGTIDHLRGEHKEVVAVINTRAGTTLDRDALEAAFGPNYEAFNIDVWSFEAAARAIAIDEKDAAQKRIAMLYYNIATALVLCGPAMRIVVL